MAHPVLPPFAERVVERHLLAAELRARIGTSVGGALRDHLSWTREVPVGNQQDPRRHLLMDPSSNPSAPGATRRVNTLSFIGSTAVQRMFMPARAPPWTCWRLLASSLLADILTHSGLIRHWRAELGLQHQMGKENRGRQEEKQSETFFHGMGTSSDTR